MVEREWVPIVVRLVLSAFLFTFVTAVLLNGSPLDEVININIYPIYLPAEGRERNPPLLEWCVLALVLLTLAGIVTFRRPMNVLSSYLFKAGLFGLTLLYLSDPFLSTLEPYFFVQRFWPLWMMLTFYLSYLLADSEKLRSITVDFIVLLTGVQATYAIIFHALDVNQFYTPNFGARTQGTYINPNTLYPVVLWGAALAFARYIGEPIRTLRCFHFVSLWLCLLAIWFTYTRSAWLAIGVVCGILVAVYRKQLVKPQIVFVLLIMSVFVLGTLFVRTKGHIMGNPDDRSAWGRLQIWRTAITIYRQHPLIGHGVMSYRYWQNRLVTKELAQFMPLNTEAKSLFLNFAVEFGAVGLFMLIASFWHLGRVCRYLLSQQLGHQDHAIVSGCYLATIGTVVAGLFDTPVLEAHRLPSSVLLMMTWGMVASIADKTPPTTLEPHFRFPRLVRSAIIAAGVVTLIWGLWVAVHALLLVNQARPKLLKRVQTVVAKPSSLNKPPVPTFVKDTFIASEDGYFLQHHGVDWQALHRALRVNIRNLAFKQGGSTITMQTARYLFLGREKSLSRKVAEILLALEMEKHLSKE
ncbi:MAG: transglycosylase domain-containing protein, partial [Chthonomonadetes bacterium]|nr:transglycosylase domain-containing protein [Chthonomonadetes bacterium]